ncbi:hypothetical protein C7974DRAFT_185531 [Boeremia exigua]|uniref:uncharacterized protein n=1 Tax=Boeremia exigua TaxID=749465 RepID=UPI001E8CF359|nr:uncharacterized protein C7974DRAFT_185531 [Boeremia exigua]KAH6629390.1 hypothetical protein C7974DRAFT_185531 [Boeremia exigua]
MLSSTRTIYSQTFVAPTHILLQGDRFNQPEHTWTKEDDMLLVQPRKRSRTAFDHDHATTHPASWQSGAKDATGQVRTSTEAVFSTSRDDHTDFSKSSIAALSLEQLQELSTQIADRIQIKKRYNNTPLRRIIARQTSGDPSPTPARSEEDAFSQTDTLVNSEILGESPETIQARYNNTPLRRILFRQVSTEQRNGTSCQASAYEPESLEVRKARYNNTPLRRILSRQESTEHAKDTTGNITAPTLPDVSLQASPSVPVPRSNTPLRRILSRQTTAPTSPPRSKEEDELSDRADSVISPDSPILASRQPIQLTSESRIRAYETALWGLSKPALVLAEHFNSEATIRAYEEALWAKPAPQAVKSGAVVIEVRELGVDAKKPKRIVVDSKGSPLRRILQRQTSLDWRASARVGVL